MGDLVSDGGEFSCNFCTGKLKLNVINSSACGDSKKLANRTNCFFPPPGGNCTFPPGVPPSPCPGIPPGSVISTGQTTVKIDGQTALGDGCQFLCPKGQPVTLSKAGQTIAKHNEASSGERSPAAVAAIAAIAAGKAVTEPEVAKPTQNPPPQEIDPDLAAENKTIAEKIASGHAYDKHILGQPYGRGPNRQVFREFPGEMRTKKQFRDHIEKVMNNPDTPRKVGSGNRTAYYDDEYGAVIIKHPSAKDGGTMFQPKTGREYFDGLFKTGS